jgi:hypothetical protein
MALLQFLLTRKQPSPQQSGRPFVGVFQSRCQWLAGAQHVRLSSDSTEMATCLTTVAALQKPAHSMGKLLREPAAVMPSPAMLQCNFLLGMNAHQNVASRRLLRAGQLRRHSAKPWDLDAPCLAIWTSAFSPRQNSAVQRKQPSRGVSQIDTISKVFPNIIRYLAPQSVLKETVSHVICPLDGATIFDVHAFDFWYFLGLVA